MYNIIKEELGINEWLELIKEDKSLNGAYISISQFIWLLQQENTELKEKIKKLSQWDVNKDTRNSRQRVANAKLLKENQNLKKQLEEYQLQNINLR